MRENEQGVPFLFYNWNKYVHRNNPEQIISRDDYMKLYEEEQKLYKGVHNREIRTLFNIDQTTLPYVDKERYETTLRHIDRILICFVVGYTASVRTHRHKVVPHPQQEVVELNMQPSVVSFRISSFHCTAIPPQRRFVSLLIHVV